MLISEMFPKRFISAEDLQGRDVPVTIARMGQDRVHREAGDELVYVLFFQKKNKGLVLNKTVALQIAELHGQDTDGWMGKRITLYPTTTRAFGKVHAVVRVRPTIPPPVAPPSQAQPEPTSFDDDDDPGEEFDEVPFSLREPASAH